MVDSTITLDKLRPRNLTPELNAYFLELERILRDVNDEVVAITTVNPASFDSVTINFDSENITFDQVTL